MVITNGGQASWYWQSTTSHDGTDAAQSGKVSAEESSTFSLTAAGPGTVSFWWKVSSEEDCDYLRFQIEGVEQDNISGEVGWQQKSYPLAAGIHTLRWTYSKDEVVDDGADCGWVDHVVIPNGLIAYPITSLFNTGVSTNNANGSPLILTADGANDQHYSIIASPSGATAPFVTLSGLDPFPAWNENTTTSKWISLRATYPEGDDQDPVGSYTYKTTFDLAGIDMNTVVISGQLVADNYISEVRINGFSMAFTTEDNDEFYFSPITIPNGHYLAGINTLEFDVFNNVPNGGNPTGLRVELSGAAYSSSTGNTIEMWRQTYFGSPNNTGNAANSADPDKDGFNNLLEFAFGLHPLQASANQGPKWQRSGDILTSMFTQPAGIIGIIYGAEWSPTMAAGSWQPLTDTGTVPQHTFTVPVTDSLQKFVRLKVTTP